VSLVIVLGRNEFVWCRYPFAGASNPRVRLGVVNVTEDASVRKWMDLGPDPVQSGCLSPPFLPPLRNPSCLGGIHGSSGLVNAWRTGPSAAKPSANHHGCRGCRCSHGSPPLAFPGVIGFLDQPAQHVHCAVTHVSPCGFLALGYYLLQRNCLLGNSTLAEPATHSDTVSFLWASERSGFQHLYLYQVVTSTLFADETKLAIGDVGESAVDGAATLVSQLTGGNYHIFGCTLTRTSGLPCITNCAALTCETQLPRLQSTISLTLKPLHSFHLLLR
jgi:hypothetical protein